MKENNLGIYIHVPFCRSKCPYCDFYSVILSKNGAESTKTAYIEAILHNINDFFTQNESKLVDLCKNNGNLSIFIGGGTPNTLNFTQIEYILSTIVKKTEHIFTQNAPKEPNLCKNSKNVLENCEISMEMNPFLHKYDEIVEFCVKIHESGVNRLSIGAQSFDNEVLKKLGRLHKAEDVIETVKAAREAGFKNISLDLMFGIPGQSIETWLDTVRQAVSLPITHISLYSLEFMEGTRFTKLLDEGKIAETEPELDREMYHKAIEILHEAGFEQYEISNFAREGYQSKHNTKYWNFDEYVGFGPSAHSLLIGDDGIARRYSSPADLDEYIADPLSQELYEELSIEDQTSEYTFTALRMNRGIDLNKFHARFGMDFFERFPKAKGELQEFIDTDCVELTDNKLRLTVKGFDISNRIFELFV